MGKLVAKKSQRAAASGSKKSTGTPVRGTRRTLAEVNAWMKDNYPGIIEAARKNCIRLTGKPTFGGMRRRKSA